MYEGDDATMTTTGSATGTVTVKAWDEGPFAELREAPKLTRAQITYSYRGDIEGEGTSQLVMLYSDEATATYIGYERVVGKLGGRSGSFVVHASGTYEDGVATTTLAVVPGSGTSELAGLRGEGSAVAQHGSTDVTYQLAYRFD
jgi:Protein of unknown function (DUF3224)